MIINGQDNKSVIDLWFIFNDERTGFEYAYKEDFTLRRYGMKTKFLNPTRKYNMI